MLVIHLRRAASVEERNRTWLLLAAVTVISPLASSEVWADLGFDVPRLGSVGILSFNAILMVAALRFRLFDKALSPSAALSATVIAAVGGIAYLSIFRVAGTNTALLVFGTLTVTLVLLAAARLIVGTVISRRDQLVRLATLGRMSAQMGHDLKNPLAALKGAAQFLREERAQGRSIDDRTEFLDLIVQQIDRLKGVVDKYQRLGRVEPVRTRVQVNELVQTPGHAAEVRQRRRDRGEGGARLRSPRLLDGSGSGGGRAGEPAAERLRGDAARRRRRR